jgi:hypothetical protein
MKQVDAPNYPNLIWISLIRPEVARRSDLLEKPFWFPGTSPVASLDSFEVPHYLLLVLLWMLNNSRQ